MKVELIDYAGAGSSDPMYAAKLLVYTKNTRLEQNAETRAKVDAMTSDELAAELDYISKTIRSSWEFVDFTFQINGVTRAFTHQFVRTRTGSYAQQSQRSVGMAGFTAECPPTIAANVAAKVEWDALMGKISETYSRWESEGISPQDCRAILPTNVHTNIIAKFNLRTLADMIGKRKNLRAQGEYADVARAMAAEVDRVMPWTDPFINPERLKTPELEAMLKVALGTSSPVDLPRVNAALKELDALKGVWG